MLQPRIGSAAKTTTAHCDYHRTSHTSIISYRDGLLILLIIQSVLITTGYGTTPPLERTKRQSNAEGPHGRAYTDEARYNLATRIMSNGVEVIVAGDKSTLPGKGDLKRILPSSVQKPVTLNPTTLSDQMFMLLPQDDNESQKGNHQFVTKTCLTTYTYLTTYLMGSTTTVSSHEQVVSNVATEERNTGGNILRTPTLGITLTQYPNLSVGTFHTTYTYLNTILDGEQPIVMSSRRTVTNTVTAPNDYLNVLKTTTPLKDTNTYYSTLSLHKTLYEGQQSKVVSTNEIVTQVVITESTAPKSTSVMTSYIALDQDANYSTSDVVKTYLATYTYLNTVLEDGSTVIYTNISTSSDVVTEKMYMTPSEQPTESQFNIWATKTYHTTFTYFTTLLQENSTIVQSSSSIAENVMTERLDPKMLNSDLLDSLASNMISTPYTTLATLNDGQALEITIQLRSDHIQPTKVQPIERTPMPDPIQSTPSPSVVTGSTIIFLDPELEDDVFKVHATPSLSAAKTKTASKKSTKFFTTPKPTSSSTIKSALATKTNHKNKPAPTKAPPPAKVPDLLGLGSINIQNLQALRPVLNAMAGLIQTNLKAKRHNNTTITPIPSTTVTTPAPLFHQQQRSKSQNKKNPIYIPVGEFADDSVEVAESQNIATIHLQEYWHKDPKSVVPPVIVNKGIPISPGDFINTNSDVIVGRPNGPIAPRLPTLKPNTPPPTEKKKAWYRRAGTNFPPIIHAPNKDDYVGPPPPIPSKSPSLFNNKNFGFNDKRFDTDDSHYANSMEGEIRIHPKYPNQTQKTHTTRVKVPPISFGMLKKDQDLNAHVINHGIASHIKFQAPPLSYEVYPRKEDDNLVDYMVPPPAPPLTNRKKITSTKPPPLIIPLLTDRVEDTQLVQESQNQPLSVVNLTDPHYYPQPVVSNPRPFIPPDIHQQQPDIITSNSDESSNQYVSYIVTSLNPVPPPIFNRTIQPPQNFQRFNLPSTAASTTTTTKTTPSHPFITTHHPTQTPATTKEPKRKQTQPTRPRVTSLQLNPPSSTTTKNVPLLTTTKQRPLLPDLEAHATTSGPHPKRRLKHTRRPVYRPPLPPPPPPAAPVSPVHHAGNQIRIVEEPSTSRPPYTPPIPLSTTPHVPKLKPRPAPVATPILTIQPTILPTHYVTHTQTATVTITKTSIVEESAGKPASTFTLLLTKTEKSTIIDTITHVHTVVQPTTQTVTTTISPTSTTTHSTTSTTVSIASVDQTTPSIHTTIITPTTVATEQSNKGVGIASIENDSIFVVMTDKGGAPAAPNADVVTSAEEGAGSYETQERSEVITDIGAQNVLLGGILLANRPTHELPKTVQHQQNSISDQCSALCKPARNEKCHVSDGRARCVCRAGFSRMFPDRPCTPTYTYTIALDTHGNDTTALVHHAIDRMVMQSDLRDIYQNVQIVSMQPRWPTNRTTVTFYLQLSENTDHNRLQQLFTKQLRSSGQHSVGGTAVRATQPLHLRVSDFDECTHAHYHDCSEHAHCFNLPGTYTCGCREGYADVSENELFPGRVCSADVVGCERCSYHGTCYTVQERPLCQCFAWYGGQYCHINLKVLLIALVTLGSMLVLLLMVCVIISCCCRRPRVRIGNAHIATHTSRSNMKPPRHHMGGLLHAATNATLAMDRRAMVVDSSSEDGRSDAQTPPILALRAAHRKSQQQCDAILAATGTSTIASDHQKDRSLTVMIPRAKYHPGPTPPIPPSNSNLLMHYTTFDARNNNNSNTNNSHATQEAKLLSYLDAGPRPPPPQQSIHKQKKLSDASSQPTTVAAVVRKAPVVGGGGCATGAALISAGYEVSATVRPPASHERSLSMEQDKPGDEEELVVHRRHRQPGGSMLMGGPGDDHDEWIDIRPRVPTIISESRSFDETTIPVAKTFSTIMRHEYDSKAGSSTRLHHNDEANTMAERDLGSTFLLPQTHLYKPDRGSEASGIESL